ncbi:MAG TPA: tyrosine-type recombinase/integrase [Actinomycetota bacterium]|nr:tyrosine-type recombinase/integrase [Actinomycetota bacterium]
MTQEARRRSRGSGSIKPRPGGFLAEVRTAEGGTASRTFKSEKQAEAWLARAAVRQEDGSFVSPRRGTILVKDWCPTWRASKVNLRPTTAARLDGVLREHVLPRFGRCRISAIQNSAVRSWVAEMETSGLSASTIRKAFFALRDMLQAAVADRRIAFNPCDDVPLPAEPDYEPHYLDMAQIADLADSILDRFRAFVILAAYGGLRYGELAGLRRKHVDLDRGRVTVVETMVEANGKITFGPPKTKRSRRTVPFPRRVMKELREHLARYVDDDPDALVFTGPNGGVLRRAGFRRCFWIPAVQAAGVGDLRVHDLRHTFVSLWVAAGRNVKEVSIAAGHSSVAFTLNRYGGLYESDEAGIQDALDALLDAREARQIADSSRTGTVAYL